jgi:hypothetical protein
MLKIILNFTVQCVLQRSIEITLLMHVGGQLKIHKNYRCVNEISRLEKGQIWQH